MHAAAARPTGVPELDRVLGGGLVAGSVTLLGGEPGMGKSTLLLQALGRMAGRGARCLLVTAEESSAQVRLRAERLGALAARPARRRRDVAAARASPTSNGARPTCSRSTRSRPSTIPTFPARRARSPRCATARTGSCSRPRNASCATVLVGHVTKDGTLAGPRVLEHVVDTVLSFDGDRHHALRMLHALKHRFGTTDELGLFEMTEHGLVDVPDASARFLADRRAGVPGSVVAAVLEGTRPCSSRCRRWSCPTAAPMPRRSARGHRRRGLAMLLAVLEQHAGVTLADGRRLRERRGWAPRHRARRRPRARARGRGRAAASSRSSATRSWSARSGSAARCARCRSSTGGSPKRRVSGSARDRPRRAADHASTGSSLVEVESSRRGTTRRRSRSRLSTSGLG